MSATGVHFVLQQKSFLKKKAVTVALARHSSEPVTQCMGSSKLHGSSTHTNVFSLK